MGRSMRLPHSAPLSIREMDVHQIDEAMLTFCIALNRAVRGFYAQVKEAFAESATADCHGFKPEDLVYIQTHKRKCSTA